MDLTLDRVRKFVTNWGGKDSFKTIHVIGTNGKGSVSSYLSSIAIDSGYKVGLYNSPHFISPRERIKVQGKMFSESDWVHAANRVFEIAPDCGLTYFELLTCMAFVLFQEEGIEVAIMEAGLGGLYDATKVIEPEFTVFTPIGMDHENILGKTLKAIATDKSGAMQPHGVCLSAPQEDEALKVLQNRASEIETRLLFPVKEDLPEGVKLKLTGEHQLANANTACSAWREFCSSYGFKYDKALVRSGLEAAFIPGRLQRVMLEREYFLDGAHNIHAFRALEKAVNAMERRPDHIIFGCMRDKELSQIKPILKSLTDGMIITTGIPGNERAFPEKDLAAVIGPRAVPAPNIKAALELLPPEAQTVLICGSLYLLSGFYTIYPEFLNG